MASRPSPSLPTPLSSTGSAQRPPNTSRTPRPTPAAAPLLLLLHVSSSVLTCILAFSFSFGHAGSTQGASPLLQPPPRLSSRHRRLRVRQPLLRSAGSMSPSRRCPSSVPDLACPRPSASPATSAGTLPTASSTCVRTTMTAPPSAVWAVPRARAGGGFLCFNFYKLPLTFCLLNLASALYFLLVTNEFCFEQNLAHNSNTI